MAAPLSEERILAWATATFPTSNPHSLIRHLAEEFHELYECIQNGDDEGAAAEIGDMGLMLIHLASMLERSFAECVAAKFATASARAYRFDPDLGYARHVDDAEAP